MAEMINSLGPWWLHYVGRDTEEAPPTLVHPMRSARHPASDRAHPPDHHCVCVCVCVECV